MPRQRSFNPLQAQEIARAFNREGVEYLFIGKSGAILLGYPAVTQDVDLFLPKSEQNARKVIRALRQLGFRLPRELQRAIRDGRDFIQLKTGPFDVDLVHAPDGITDFASAKRRSIRHEEFPIAALEDIIASKRASGRAKDFLDLELLEAFRAEYHRAHPKRLKSALEKVTRARKARN